MTVESNNTIAIASLSDWFNNNNDNDNDNDNDNNNKI